MNPWFELNWLRKYNKHIPLPKLVFSTTKGYSGCYYRPAQREIIIDNKFYDLLKGLIIIVDNDYYVNTLAHEWRHHMQWYYGIKHKTNSFNKSGNYKSNIIKYFKDSECEMDALLYSIKIAPDDLSLEWYQWIIKFKEE